MKLKAKFDGKDYIREKVISCLQNWTTQYRIRLWGFHLVTNHGTITQFIVFLKVQEQYQIIINAEAENSLVANALLMCKSH